MVTQTDLINRGWLAEFEAAAQRLLKQRFKYASIKTYKPVLNDERYRSFEAMEEYRQWCETICWNGWVIAANENQW